MTQEIPVQNDSYKVVKFNSRLRCDPQLQLFHNTRHAAPKHSFINKSGVELRSPWLSRFDWVLDANLEADHGEGQAVVLSILKESPRCVFVKLRLLPLFVNHILPQLDQSILLYIGNANLALSQCRVDIPALVEHPKIHRLFCENKNSRSVVHNNCLNLQMSIS